MNKSTKSLGLGIFALTLCAGNVFATEKQDKTPQQAQVEQTLADILKTATPEELEMVFGKTQARFTPSGAALTAGLTAAVAGMLFSLWLKAELDNVLFGGGIGLIVGLMSYIPFKGSEWLNNKSKNQVKNIKKLLEDAAAEIKKEQEKAAAEAQKTA